MIRSSRYTAVAITLHWVIAMAILFMIWLGWNMDGNEARYQFHKSLGITILLLSVARIGWRVFNPPPPLPDEMNELERQASHVVHMVFYGLMLFLPLSGWLLVSTSFEFDVPTVLFGAVSWPDIPFVDWLKNDLGHGIVYQVHGKSAWLALAMLALHVGGALKHEFSAEEGVLKRMVPGLFGQSDPPALPSRGALISFGLAFGLFAVIAGTPLLGSSSSSSSASGPAEAAIAANWDIDYRASSIRFSGSHDGDTYSGDFSDWTAAIVFDPDVPASGRADISVGLASASANKKLYTDSLKSPEWFNTEAFPTANVIVSDIAETPDGYTSTATLLLKGLTVSAPLNFELVLDGGAAIMTGQAVFQRTPLDLGQASDPSADWVGEDVIVDVRVEASRAN